MGYFPIHTPKGLDLIVTYSSPRRPGRVCVVIFLKNFQIVIEALLEMKGDGN